MSQQLRYERRVPKFLRGYAHLLQADKKNYMGEEIGYDEVATEGFQSEKDIEEDGGVIVRKEIGWTGLKGKREGYEQVEQEDEEEREELTEVPSARDYFPEEEDAKEKAKKETESKEEYFKDGKVIFHAKRGQKRLKDDSEKEEESDSASREGRAGKISRVREVAEDEGTERTEKTKKQKIQSEKKKVKLLSFDEDL